MQLEIPTMKSLDSDKNASKADADEAPAANDNNGFFTPNEKINFSNVKIEPLFEECFPECRTVLLYPR